MRRGGGGGVWKEREEGTVKAVAMATKQIELRNQRISGMGYKGGSRPAYIASSVYVQCPRRNDDFNLYQAT